MILEGGAAIAAYVKRDIRTVRRWAKEHGFPVRRLKGKLRAHSRRIDLWIKMAETPLTEGEGSP